MAVATEVRTATPKPPRMRRALIGSAIALAVVVGAITIGVHAGICEPKFATWMQLITSGLTLGAVYAMIALGYTMVYGVLQLINFAHSEVFMVGTFAGLYVITGLFGINGTSNPNGIAGGYLVLVIVVGVILCSLASGTTAVLLERIAYRPLRRRGASRLGYLITAIGASLFIQQLFLLMDGQHHLGLPFRWPLIAGNAPRNVPTVMQTKTLFTLWGDPILNTQVLVIAVSVVMLIILDLFVRRTRAGMGMRAVAEDPEMAALMGVSIEAIIVLTFFVGGLMAGGAGMLFVVFFGQTRFNVGFLLGIQAFTAAVLGGIGNIRGAMLGGILLGLIENVGVACTGLQWQPVVAFLVLVAVLMFRPTGILGEQVGG